MRLLAKQHTLLTTTPILLLAAQSLLSSSLITPCYASASSYSTSSSSSHGMRSLSSEALAKMSNGEGYVADQLSPRATQLIQDSIDLFSAKPNHAIFQRSWQPDAIFEDPLCFAKGARQYKAQWWGLAALFSKCELLAWHVTKDTPEEVNYVQRQRYTFRGIGYTKEIVSTIRMRLDEQGKVIHMQDRWNHQDPPAGFIAWPLRRFNAVTVPLFVSIPNETKAHDHREL